MKHAMMIMAHGDYDQLRNLVSLLDHEDIDIYIHINKRSSDWEENILNGATNKSNIFFVKRVPIYYCDYSQIKAQMSLLTSAINRQYDYYHLLSGADLPIHPLTHIFEFFESNHGREFVGFQKDYDIRRAGIKAFFSNKIRTTKGVRSKIYIRLNKYLEQSQFLLGVNFAQDFNGSPYKGSDWWSISDDAARYIVENEPCFRKYFRRCYCPSELFIQTLLYNSEFKNKIFNLEDECIGSCRYIDWHRGQPYVWRKDDFNDLINSPYIFARKFSPHIDNEIISLISNHVKQ